MVAYRPISNNNGSIIARYTSGDKTLSITDNFISIPGPTHNQPCSRMHMHTKEGNEREMERFRKREAGERERTDLHEEEWECVFLVL